MKCFEKCSNDKDICKNTECRHWLESESFSNCAILAAQKGPLTLQSIGDIFGITRMRVCQIEKKILSKIKPALAKKIS